MNGDQEFYMFSSKSFNADGPCLAKVLLKKTANGWKSSERVSELGYRVRFDDRDIVRMGLRHSPKEAITWFMESKVEAIRYREEEIARLRADIEIARKALTDA